MKNLILAAALCWASVGAAADHWAASFSNDVVTVAESASETLGTVNLMDEATLEKRGKGELIVPLANVVQQKDFRLKVSEGRVKVTAGTVPSADVPTDILNRAALWLDAADEDSLVTATGADGNEYVARWLDTRETKNEAPFDYLVALSECNDTAATHTNFPVKATMLGFPVVDLKGVGSGAEFSFVKSLTEKVNTTSLQAREVFVVYCQTREKYGFLFGGSAYGYNNSAFHPSVSTITPQSGTIMRLESAASLDARFWQNGVEIDAMKEKCALGSRVFGTHFMGVPATLTGIGSYSFSSSENPERNGGDGFAEVLIFTNRLSLVEHARVERYLCAKYGKTIAATGSYTFDMAPGAEIVFDGVDPSAVKVTGTVALPRPTSGDFTVDYHAGVTDLKVDALGGGTTTLKCEAVLPVAAGTVLTAGEGYVGTDVIEADAAPGNVDLVKTGLQKVTLRTVPSGLRRITAQQGVLALSSAYATTNREVYASITNWNFDCVLDAESLKEKSKYGWQGHYWALPGFSDSYPELVRQRGQKDDGSWVDSNWYMYKGQGWDRLIDNGYAALRGASALSTTVKIPEAGDYELSFDWSRLLVYARLRVMIGPDLDHMRDVGYVIDIDSTQQDRPENLNGYLTWSRRSFRLNALPAGDQVLMFRSDADGSGNYRSTLLFDNVVMKKLPDDNALWELVGGDFEGLTTNNTFAAGKVAADRKFGPDYTLDDWECVQPEGAWAIAPATSGMTSTNADGKTPQYFGYYSPLLDRCDRPGHAQLVMGNKDGYAQKRISLPAGEWKLMADLVPFRKTDDMGTELRRKSDAAQLTASAQVGDAAAVALGTVSADGTRAKFDQQWTTSFVVPDGGADVLVKLQLTSANAGAVVDNLRLVRVTGADAGDLVTDGEFNSGATTWKTDASLNGQGEFFKWTRASANNSVATTAAEYNCCYPHHDGATSGKFALIGDCASVYQDVTFPAAGLYRLTYYTRSRNNWSNPGEVRMSWGRNRLLAYTAANGKTNTIDIALVDTTNWVQHAAVFKVDAPATVSFGFRGLNVPTSKDALDGADNGGRDKAAFFDGVSIVKVDADVCEPVSLPPDLSVRVAQGAKLQLGFDGTIDVNEVKLGGRRATGVVNSETYPDYVFGPGALNVTGDPPGMILLVR